MKQVCILALPGALGSTISIPLEMLNAANDIVRAQHREIEQVALVVAGLQPGPVKLNGGLSVNCDSTINELSNPDLIFIPGMWGNPITALRRIPALPDWLGRMHEQGSTLCAIATGSFFIAESGVLDKRNATTHWRYFEKFTQRYPQVKLQRKRFITQDKQVFCTGSVNAARDIMLHFVELLFDEEVANQVAHHFTHELKRSYESLLLNKDQQSTHHDEVIIKVQEWLQDNFANAIDLATIADQFELSVRSLNRRFKNASNTTPRQYLQELRIAQAKDLLKQSNLVISEVADRVGYQDASYFTALFKKLNAVTPNEYRHLVRNKLFVAESKKEPGLGPGSASK